MHKSSLFLGLGGGVFGHHKFWSTLVVLALFWGSSPKANGCQETNISHNTVEAFIQNIVKKGEVLLSNPNMPLDVREKKIQDMLQNNFDVAYMARFVLGYHWNSLDPAKKTTYIALFQKEVVRSYLVRLGAFKSDSLRVLFVKKPREHVWIVKATLCMDENTLVNVEWIVEQQKTHLYIKDITVEGLSLLLTKRSEYAALIGEKRGIDPFLKALEHLVQNP